MKIIDLKQERSNKRREVANILKLANNEGRGLNEDEQTKFDALETRINQIDELIINAEKEQELQRQIAAEKIDKRHNTQVATPEEKVKKRYSLAKAIKEYRNTGKLTGVEAEMDQEARAKNPSITGIGVPDLESRTTLTSGTAATAGNAVATDLSGNVIDSLQPMPLIRELGATFVTGLTSDLDMLRFTAEGDGAWEGETDANAEMNPTTDKLSWTPNRYGAYTQMSKTLQIQQDHVTDFLLARNIRRSTERALDTQAFNGSGSPITGVLNLTNVGDVAGGTNGAVPTWANIVDLETQITADNARGANLKIVTTPQIVGLLKTVKKDAGSGIFVIENNQANGFDVYSSTLVPSTLDKGTSTGVCHAIILGDWSQLIVGQFGGYDIVVDPYSNARNAILEIVVNSWWDMQFEHDQAFSAMQDALLS